LDDAPDIRVAAHAELLSLRRVRCMAGRVVCGPKMKGVPMNQQEVLALFRTRAQSLGQAYYRFDEIVSLLAKAVSHSRDNLSSEDFDALVYIGGVLHKESAKRTRARAEVAQTMQASHDAQGRSPKS
jgi:hypothetical protein